MNAAYRLYLSAVGSGSMSNRIIGLRSAKNRLIQSHPSQIGNVSMDKIQLLTMAQMNIQKTNFFDVTHVKTGGRSNRASVRP
jgi:hypothetical protein